MTMDLNEYIEANPPKGFSPVPHYFRDGDYVSRFLTNERCVATRIDETLTLYHSDATGDLVGYKIKGIKWLTKFALHDRMRADGVMVDEIPLRDTK